LRVFVEETKIKTEIKLPTEETLFSLCLVSLFAGDPWRLARFLQLGREEPLRVVVGV